MGQKKEFIYGIEFEIPNPKSKLEIANAKLIKPKQKFYRVEIPDIFNDLEFDDQDNPLYEQAHIDFINRELDRIDAGYWFYNNGQVTYITGLHYFYLNYWTLEDGTRPDYRDCDRRYFYFQAYCESKGYIDGIIRAKKRREGATSQASADIMKSSITIERAFCGIISKTGPDAEDVFLNMIMPGYRSLPIFLKPRCEDEDTKTRLIFLEKKKTTKKGVKKRGQIVSDSRGIGSKIEYRNTKLNSFDSGRKTKILIDEGGKFPADVPINEYWPIVRQTLKQGGIRVGFALLPSTSNKLTKGGRGFKKLWDESDHFSNKKTATGLYRYFSPAEEGLVPFIDEHGMSILDEPTKEQLAYMKERYPGALEDEDLKLGAKKYLDKELEKISDPEAKNEFVRMYPRSERDIFDFEDGSAVYPRNTILEQKAYLQNNPAKLRPVTFYRKQDGKVDFKDDKEGWWKILMLPNINEDNLFIESNGKRKPGNTANFTLTADPYKNTIVSGKGSKAGAYIWKKLNPLDPENSGLPVAQFWGRPKLKRIFHEQMLLAAEYYGADICYESDYDEYIEFLIGQNRFGYAMERPKSTIDPNRKVKKKTKEYGIKSADGFSYNLMLTRSVEYVILYCHKIYFMDLLIQLEEFIDTERTFFDLVVAFQLGTVAISDQTKPKEERKITSPVIRTFQLR